MEIKDLSVRIAGRTETERVKEYYDRIIDQLQGKEHTPMWTKDVYPTLEDLENAVLHQYMYLCEYPEGGPIVAAMVLNSEMNDAYLDLPWKVDARKEEMLLFSFLHGKLASRIIRKNH